MAEKQHMMSSSDDAEWQSLVEEVEHRFQAVTAAVADLRSAVNRLTAHRPAMPVQDGWSPAVPVSQPLVEPIVEQPPVATWQPAVQPPAASEPHPVPEAATADDDQARREEVSRMVAQARQEIESTPASTSEASWPGAQPLAERNAAEVDSTSEGSWPMARPREATWTQPEPSTDVEPAESAQPIDVVAEAASVAEEAEQDDEARRQEVARMVAEMRAGLVSDGAAVEEEEPASPAPEPEKNENARRDVARMVAEMRAGLASHQDDSDESEDYDDVPDDSEAAADGAPSDDAAVRDEVRRAVEAARAEMASGWVKSGAESSVAESTESKFSFPDWQNARVEPSGPPVIVMKDTEGRVELARVYETLSQVNCDENAALLNYTPHSVTVGLNARAQVPTPEDLEAAVRKVFGRKCRVESDGVRLSVDIGKDLGKEDAA